MKNIIVVVDNSYHNELKSYVAKKGMTIKQFILALIDKEMRKEKEQTQQLWSAVVFAHFKKPVNGISMFIIRDSSPKINRKV